MSFPVRSGWARGGLKSAFAFLAFLFAMEIVPLAAEPRDYAVEISVNVLTSPFALQLTWPPSDVARQYVVHRRRPGETAWGNPIATLPGNSTGFADFNVADATAYEYQVQMELNVRGNNGAWLNGYGYVYAGGNLPFADSKGKALLIVDSSVASSLASELATYQSDLIASGWSVVRRDVSRSSSPTQVRNQIRADYNADPYNVRTVVLIGHVPVPYSGNIAPDMHATHRGAWPADGFYGELDGTWTDSIVNVTSFDSEANDNRPGDGKFDQSEFPGQVELEVGRIDFWNLPAFSPRSEIDLLRNYFRKNHAYRYRGFTAVRGGLIRDNFGDLDGDAPAVDAWRHYPQFFGPGAIREVGPDAFFSTLSAESFLFSYGCGGGGFTKADAVGTTYDFAASDPKTVFLILHGSYFGDWNNGDNFLRAAIATPNYTLASIWSGLPHWFMHPMGLGATLGYCTRLTQNNRSDYKSYRNFSPGEVHISLIGDPTLDLYPVAPPSNLTASPGNVVTLSWSAPVEENLVGYHVYHSANPNGPFQRITSSALTSTSHSHNPGAGTHYYMVRSLKLERTGSGTFYNLSHGLTAAVTQGSGGTIPTVSVTTLDDDAGETGPNVGEFRFSRSVTSDSALAIDVLIGGTAQNGVDYQVLPTSLTIPAGAGELRVTLTPLMDTLSEGDETMTLQIRPNPSYTIGSPAIGFLRIRDAAVNQAPSISAVPDQFISVDTNVTVVFEISDPETPAGNLNVRGLSSNPSLVPLSRLVFGGSGASRTVTVSPIPGATGVTTITLLVSDGNIETSRTFEVTVTRPNLPPIAQAQSIAVFKNSSASIVLAGSDPEGALLTFIVKTPPGKGTLSGTAPNLSFIPYVGVIGQDSFTFSVSDGELESSPATVTIQIFETNRPPVALAQEITTDEDTSVGLSLSGVDPDGDPLLFEILSGPTKGVLSGRGQNYQYTPSTNSVGADSFSFRVSDGTAVSDPATISISINPVNDPPVAVGKTVSTAEDVPVSISVGASDPDGDALTFRVVSPPERGAITGAPPNLVYTPLQDFNGSDSFTLVVSDGTMESAPATVTIVIEPQNDVPTVNSISPQFLAKNKNLGPLAVVVDDADKPINGLLVTATSSHTNVVKAENIHVTGAGTNRSLSLTPEPGATGATILTLTVNDGEIEAQSSFLLTITNTPPVAVSDSLSVDRTTVEIPVTQVTGNDFDPDGDPLLVVWASTSARGRPVKLTGNTIGYWGEAGITNDSFDYTIEDSSGAKAVGTVNIIFLGDPRIDAITLSGDGVVLRLSGAPLRSFRVLNSADARIWTVLGEGVTDANGMAEFHHDGSLGPHRFYRTEWP